MIYYDPSEGRKGTRLPDTVVKAGKPLPNLEMYTGADLLVTTYERKIVLREVDEDTLIDVALMLNNGKSSKEISQAKDLPLPAVIPMERFWCACQEGVLIQRKSGMDYVSSVFKLDEIFGRMSLWTPDPILLVSANILCNRKGNTVVDGKDTNLPYHVAMARKISWGFSGGNIIEVPRDALIPLVVDYLNRKLTELKKDDTKYIVRRKWNRQQIIGPSDKRWPWMQILVDLPGIGNKKAKAVADFSGDLVSAIIYLTDPDQDGYKNAPKIVNQADIRNIRELFGLAEGVRLDLISTKEGD